MSVDTLILVAHRAGARLLTRARRNAPLALLEEIPHPEGRLREHDLDSDAGGRVFDRQGGHRHAVAPEHSATEHEAENFARTLADRLRDARVRGECGRIVLVADARSLGRIRAALDDVTSALVTQSIDKDLAMLATPELIATLEENLED
jgi:protein required for attachment to host cells